MCNCKDYSLQDAIDELYSKFNVLKELNEYNNKGYMTHFPFMECETIINGYVMSVEEIRVQILVAPTLLKTKKKQNYEIIKNFNTLYFIRNPIYYRINDYTTYNMVIWRSFLGSYSTSSIYLIYIFLPMLWYRLFIS